MCVEVTEDKKPYAPPKKQNNKTIGVKQYVPLSAITPSIPL
jgi:hypothetical protein